MRWIVLVTFILYGCSETNDYISDDPCDGSFIINHDFAGDEAMRFPIRPPEEFQGLILRAPSAVSVSPMELGRSVWDRGVSGPAEVIYEGELNLKGVFSVFVPDGDQETIWSGLSRKIDVVVRDLTTGQVQNYRHGGGYHVVRMGINPGYAQRVPPYLDYSAMPSNVVHYEHFNIELFDGLMVMPKPDTTLEIYVEYMGFKSDVVEVRVLREERQDSDKWAEKPALAPQLPDREIEHI